MRCWSICLACLNLVCYKFCVDCLSRSCVLVLGMTIHAAVVVAARVYWGRFFNGMAWRESGENRVLVKWSWGWWMVNGR
jgi:hypothetical protein